MMNITKTAKQVHQTAKNKGWWDKKRNKDEMHMLAITELAEAVEADREDRYADISEFERITSDKYSGGELPEDQWKAFFETEIKDTVEDEIADCFIRCLDYLYWKHRDYISIPSYNIVLWDDNFASNVFYLCQQLTDRRVSDTVAYIEKFCNHYNIDLEWHVRNKMRYNGMREKHHGGKKY